MSVIRYNAVRYNTDNAESVSDALAIEGPLTISINGEVFTITMRSPGSDEALVRGLLFTEDVYKSRTKNPEFIFDKRDNLGNAVSVNVLIDKNELGDRYLNKRSLLSVTSCGICGKTELLDHDPEQELNTKNTINLKAESIPNMFLQMKKNQGTFKESGGSHASSAFDENGNLLSLQEDIGRHNAVDKVIGDLLQNNKLKQAKILLVSGRISYEIVSKCFMAGIPVLAAVSAPSSLAVDFAKELGITLLAFCREDYFTVYSHPEKLNIQQPV